MSRLGRLLARLRPGAKPVLMLVVVLPAALLLLVINNWNEMQESMSRESVITVMRSRVDAAKFTSALNEARADGSTSIDEVMLRLDIMMSRRGIIERVPDVRFGGESVRADAEHLLGTMTQIDQILTDESLSIEQRLLDVAELSRTLDSLFQRIETYALSESNQRIRSNINRSEQLLWLSALLSISTMLAAGTIWWYRRRDTMLLREQNAALERERRQSDHNALHDELTGMPNRRYFDRMLRALAPEANRDGGIALIHIDLDRFKVINDTQGHAAGDAVLATIGRRINGLLEEGEFAARIGGDEFIVILPGTRDSDAVTRKADALGAALSRPITFGASQCRVSASLGIAEYGPGTFNPEALMINADTALYQAKKDGRNRHAFFTEEMRIRANLDRILSEDLRRGIEAREFIPVYQPQFDARTRLLVGAEALARWNHPTRGLLSPSEFIHMAEEMGLVGAIDDLILEQALADRCSAAQDGLHLPRLSVNVSANRLTETGLIARLKSLNIARDTLAFELVETIFLDEADDVLKANVQKIREMGIAIEIDDFGTGHASISGLVALAPDRIKIDRLFVEGIETSVDKRTLLASVIAIGKSRRIEIVAEGVETEEQARILTQLGCDILQGHALGRPMGFPALRRQLLPIEASSYAAS